jgi:phospholipase C
LLATLTAGTASAHDRERERARDHTEDQQQDGERDQEHRARPARLDKLEHIVVLMQENRSFDSYFGLLHDQGQPRTAELPDEGNPDPTNLGGPPIRPFHEPDACISSDVEHGWTATHQQINGGKMDGFTSTNATPEDPTGRRALGYYDQSDLPFYTALARTFGIGDRYFGSVPGPTYPNRFYLAAATSFGHIRNDTPPPGGWTQPTIFSRLQTAGISWKIYNAQFPFPSFFADVQAHPDHLAPIADYFADAKNGTLPQVAFVEPTYIGTVNAQTAEHPPANFQAGQQFTAGVVNALMAGPNWSSSAFLLTYDEHGGYYDHVAPPRAPKPDNIPPMLRAGDTNAQFDLYGPRVPLLVVSPYSRPNFVSHRVSDHTSILKLIELRFGLDPLTQRDKHANGLLEYFDFRKPHFKTPPSLPAAAVDPAKAARCTARFGNRVVG